MKLFSRTEKIKVPVPTSEERYALSAWEPIDKPNPADMPPKPARSI